MLFDVNGNPLSSTRKGGATPIRLNNNYDRSGMPARRQNLYEGQVVATKGEVTCWEDNLLNPFRKDICSINGVGEVVTGPDNLDRYLIRINGQKAWVHADSVIAKGIR